MGGSGAGTHAGAQDPSEARTVVRGPLRRATWAAGAPYSPASAPAQSPDAGLGACFTTSRPAGLAPYQGQRGPGGWDCGTWIRRQVCPILFPFFTRRTPWGPSAVRGQHHGRGHPGRGPEESGRRGRLGRAGGRLGEPLAPQLTGGKPQAESRPGLAQACLNPKPTWSGSAEGTAGRPWEWLGRGQRGDRVEGPRCEEVLRLLSLLGRGRGLGSRAVLCPAIPCLSLCSFALTGRTRGDMNQTPQGRHRPWQGIRPFLQS